MTLVEKTKSHPHLLPRKMLQSWGEETLQILLQNVLHLLSLIILHDFPYTLLFSFILKQFYSKTYCNFTIFMPSIYRRFVMA